MPLAFVVRVLREPREPCARGRARASGALPPPTRGAPAPTTAYERHEQHDQHGFHGSPHAEARKPLRCFLHTFTRRTIAQASHALCGIHAINVRIVRKSCRGKGRYPTTPVVPPVLHPHRPAFAHLRAGVVAGIAVSITPLPGAASPPHTPAEAGRHSAQLSCKGIASRLSEQRGWTHFAPKWVTRKTWDVCAASSTVSAGILELSFI